MAEYMLVREIVLLFKVQCLHETMESLFGQWAHCSHDTDIRDSIEVARIDLHNHLTYVAHKKQ